MYNTADSKSLVLIYYLFIFIVSLFTHCNTAKSIKMVQIVINNIQIIQ